MKHQKLRGKLWAEGSGGGEMEECSGLIAEDGGALKFRIRHEICN